MILALGGNDGLRVLSVSRMRRNLSRTVEPLQKQGIKVIPLRHEAAAETMERDYREGVRAGVLPRWRRNPVPCFTSVSCWRVSPDKPSLMQDDGIHPNEDGNKVVAANVLKVLEPLLTPPAQDEQAGNP